MPTGIYPRKPCSEEIKIKIGLSNKGKKHSEETKRKISIANKGKHNSLETEYKKDHKLSEEALRKMALNHSGEKNNRWKGGRFLREGYVFVMDKKNCRCKDGYIREHIKVMEEHLGRKLNPKEVVHHLDLDTINNKLENLYLFESNGYHMNYHRKLRKIVLSIFGIK